MVSSLVDLAKLNSWNLSMMSLLTWKMENKQIFWSWIFQKLLTRSHTLLLHKLYYYGIQGELNSWIQDFLSNRKQAVVLEDEKSDYVAVESGVPQGSVLGPSLFLYYINDIPAGLASTVHLFADDTIAYLAIKSNRDALTLQQDLDKLSNWEKKLENGIPPR
jgi:hypothetical protein